MGVPRHDLRRVATRRRGVRGRRAGDGEVFLPDVVAAMVNGGATVRVLVSDDACVGVTHDEDLAAVKAALRMTALA